MRAYGTNPQVWGGDDKCDHQWQGTSPPRKRSKDDIVDADSKQMTHTAPAFDAVGGSTCIHCGAWRGELGSEPTPEMFISHLCDIFDEVKRVLRPDGVCWINISTTYVSKRIESATMTYKPKDDAGIPQQLYEALRERGWYTRAFFTWWKQNSMPSSVKDRPADSCEWVIMLTRSKSYWYDIDAERVVSKRNGDRQTFGGQKGRDYTPSATDPNFRGGHEQWGRDYTTGANRNLRTGDFMQMSLDAEIERQTLYLKSLHDIKRKGGIIHDGDGVPAGLFCNSKGIGLKHFASFPPRFVEILINLSVPKKACAECGKGWKRVVEKGAFIHTGGGTNKNKRSDSMDKGANMPIDMPSGLHQIKTLCFVPDCECDAPHDMTSDKRCRNCNANDFLASVEPCWLAGVVLDPFMGAATTAVVAERLGRRWIGIELSGEYVEMGRKRIEDENPLGLF